MDNKKYGPQDPEEEAKRASEQVQRELEYQLRQFGVSMSDAFQHGFEGRGQEIGDRAWDVGRAVVDAVNFGLSEAGRAMDRARERERGGYDASARAARAEDAAGSAADHSYEDLYSRRARREEQWAERGERWASRWTEREQRCGRSRETGSAYEEATAFPSRDPLRAGSRRTFGVGLTMAIVGGIFAFGLLIGGVSCLACLGMFLEGTAEYTALTITGVCLTVAGLLFGWMAGAGGERLKDSRRMKAYADAADVLGAEQGIPIRQLASAAQRSAKKVRKDLRRYIRKGWLTAWLDADGDRLYLTAESYRTAQGRPEPADRSQKEDRKKKTKKEPARPPQPESPAAQAEQPAAPADKAALNVETIRRFAAVLEQEKRLMADEQAAEELEHMEATTQSICEWLEAHPENLPKARRFAEYYIPTTLKLLHTYNDVQGQKGENAETIRRDIAGILHTLNLAYDNLYDKLLSDMALDVSSEIAALQGMLASDGLTGEELL